MKNILVTGASSGLGLYLSKYANKNGYDLVTVNLGTGEGYSVLEVINTFESVSAQKIKRKFVARRAGDVEISIACPTYAKLLLGWTAKYDLTRMCEDSWRWQCATLKK